MALRFDLARQAFAHTAALRHGHRQRAGGRGRRRRRVPAPRRPRAASAAPGRRHEPLPHAALRREPAPAGGLVRRPPTWRAGDLPAVLQGKELSFTNLLDVDAAVAHRRRSSSSRRRSSSSTRTRAAPRPGTRSPTPTSARGTPTRSRRSAASSGCNRDDRRGDGPGDRVDVHRGGHRAGHHGAGAGRARGEEEPAGRDRAARLPPARRQPDARSARPAFGPRRRCSRRSATAWWKRGTSGSAEGGPRGRDEAGADRRRVAGAPLRVARVRAREVEHGDLHAEDRTLAIGAGQMSRVDAVNVAVMKADAAEVPLAGSVAASDAFFPFRDGLDAVAAAGATAVVQPGGSVRDAEVIAAADEHGLAMVVHRPAPLQALRSMGRRPGSPPVESTPGRVDPPTPAERRAARRATRSPRRTSRPRCRRRGWRAARPRRGVAPAASAERQRRDHRVARAGDVGHLARDGREVGLAAAVEQRTCRARRA